MKAINLKKLLLMFLASILFIFQNINVQAEEAYLKSKDITLINTGMQRVEGKIHLKGDSKQQIKLLLIKDKEKRWYELPLKEGKFDEEIWLTMGKGKYTAAIMIHEEGRKYSYGPRITVENVGEVNPFLVPVKHVESDNEKIARLAEKLIENKTTDREKARAIYDWTTNNIAYDYEKFERHQKGDYDNTYGALHTLEEKKGVCYDYAALTAALGRAAGLQTKVVKGQAFGELYKGYHAWNEIYLADEEQWIFLDSTFGAGGQKEYFDRKPFESSYTKQEEF